MTELDEQEPTEPQVTDVPEPDQEPHEPIPDEAAEESEGEGTDTPHHPDEPSVADEGEGSVGEQQASAVLPGARDDADVETAFRQLANEATRHANRISAIMGEDAQLLQPCPRCVTSDPQRPATPGFIWPAEVVPLLPEDKAKVKQSIGEGLEPEYKTNDDAYTCPKCLGQGKYPTGSFKPDQRFIKCDQCDGRGWIGQRALSVASVTSNGPVEPAMVSVGADEPRPDADPWGRLKDDPLYGVMPGFER